MEKVSVKAGAKVEPGTYKCTKCGNEIKISDQFEMPKCPQCGNDQWVKKS